MIERKVVVIKDGMTDEEIIAAINKEPVPLVMDARTSIDKLISQIIIENYEPEDNTETISETSHRPDAIKIG